VYVERFITKVGKNRYTITHIARMPCSFTSRDKPIVSDGSTNGMNFLDNEAMTNSTR